MATPAPADRTSPVVAVTIAIAAAIVLYILVVLLHSYYENSVAAEAERKLIEGRTIELGELDSKQRGQLRSCQAVDPATPDRVTLSIERAMELVVDEFTAAVPGQPATLVPAVTPSHDQATAAAVADRATGAAELGGAP